jgi:hypothetical protein
MKYIALITAMIVMLALTATAFAQHPRTFRGTGSTGAKVSIGMQFKYAQFKQARITPHPGPTAYRVKPMLGPTAY